MRVFELMDYEYCRCTKEEIGQPWEPRWGRDDAAMRRCEAIQIGKKRNDIPWPPEEDESAMPDIGEFVFEREIAAYRRNPDEYKARNPPALVVKLLAVDEDRRTRQQSREENKQKQIEALTNEELWQAVGPVVRKIQETSGENFIPTIEKGIEHIITHYVPAEMQEKARKDALHVSRYMLMVMTQG